VNEQDRRAADALGRIIDSCRAIETYADDSSPADRMVHDAIRMRLTDIGVAVTLLPDSLLADDTNVPWNRLRGVGERLTDGCPDASPTLVRRTATHDVPVLRSAAVRLRQRVRPPAPRVRGDRSGVPEGS
jgi:uncharacterized protein with HEPN domain